jgi:tricorn protease
MNIQKRLFVTCVILGVILGLTVQASSASTNGYYRYPTLRGNSLVFSAEGDLWIVDSQGGVARRLTTHAGEETDPAISPDGKLLAFSASYEGPTELYTMPLDGGLPTRLTYEADSSTVVGFTPDGQLMYTTRAFSTIPDPQLVTIDLKTGNIFRIPLHQASDGSFDDTKKTIYFSRPGFHNNNTARYKGGTARNIWKFIFGAAVPGISGPWIRKAKTSSSTPFMQVGMSGRLTSMTGGSFISLVRISGCWMSAITSTR